MSTQYRLVQSGKTASGGCSAGQGSSEPVAPRIIIIIIIPYYPQQAGSKQEPFQILITTYREE
jgi:carbohydrate-binding DOMON domain-containing protein